MASDPEAATVCGPDIPDPATGEGVMVTLDAAVVDHWSVVSFPNSMSDGFAANVAVGEGLVFIVIWRVSVSTPEQPLRVTVRVKVVFEFTAKPRVPLEGDTGVTEPVVLSVMVAVSPLVLAHDRFTDDPGITQ
jgi:hypothetical protein